MEAVCEALLVFQCVWDKLDVWHSRVMLLESEVQDVAEEQPDQALLLMDQLTQPLQLYQNTAQMAEQRTSFLSKVPSHLVSTECADIKQAHLHFIYSIRFLPVFKSLKTFCTAPPAG